MIMENIEAICNICKLSLWEWNVSKDNFKISGYFGPFQGPLKLFLAMVDPNDHGYLKKIISQDNSSFEKKIRLVRRKNIFEWVYMRGQIHFGLDNKMRGIMLGIDKEKHSQDNLELHSLKPTHTNQENFENKAISQLIHELTQPLMVINTYIIGCIYRLQENKVDNTQLLDIMSKMKQHSAILGQTIHKLNDYLSNVNIEHRDLVI